MTNNTCIQSLNPEAISQAEQFPIQNVQYICSSTLKKSSIDNHMVSSSVYKEKICTSEFFKKMKLHEPIFEKQTSAN